MWGIEPLYFTLEDYAKWIGVSETSLYGIVATTDPDMGCDSYYWNQTDRFQFGRAFKMAERLMRRTLRFPVMRTWIHEERHHYNGVYVNLKNYHVLALGEKVIDDVALAQNTNIGLANEGEFSIPVTFTDCHELFVFYPSQTRWMITPSELSISGNTASVTIPRARLLDPSYFIDYSKSDPSGRPLYETDANFIDTVDFYRIYPDAAQAVTFVWHRRRCDCGEAQCTCNNTSTTPGEVVTQTGVGRIIDSKLGVIHVEPATYNTTTGEWEEADWSECRPPDDVLVSYVSGWPLDYYDECLEEKDPELSRALIALAHSHLPRGFCTCSNALVYWEDDAKRNTPEEGPAFASPMGVTTGAWLAWKFANRMAVGSGGLLA